MLPDTFPIHLKFIMRFGEFNIDVIKFAYNAKYDLVMFM